MSYYDNSQWTAAAAQNNWDHQTPPTRSGASSAVPREDSSAFSSQLEEVDRAIENLFKSGKAFNNTPGRRESMPMAGQGRDFPGLDPRMGGAPPRHHSVSDFSTDSRSYSGSNLQNFYANQRHQPPRASEAEQVMQAKRRMAAQRERELRNYHQEQQYNRSVTAPAGSSATGNDRTMSPASGMSEEERRDLIARQRSALYGEGATSAPTFSENGTPIGENNRPGSGGPGAAGPPAQGQASEGAPAQPERERSNSNASPSSNAPASSNFSLFDNAQQSSRTSASSPGGSPPREGNLRKGSVAPIGTRPVGAAAVTAQAQNPALAKQRSVTPLPSPLSYGYSPNEEGQQQNKPASGNGNNGERVVSASSNPSSTPEVGLGGGWGSKSGGVWGGKNSLAAQASVWG